jgi:hypothetical protein
MARKHSPLGGFTRRAIVIHFEENPPRRGFWAGSHHDGGLARGCLYRGIPRPYSVATNCQSK